MKLGSIRLDNTCYKCTKDRKIVTCMIKKSEYCKLKLKYICKMQRYGSDECLKHSYYTRVGLLFSRLFYNNYIVFVVRSLIWCLVWMQVFWSEKSSCWKQVLEQWGSEQGSDWHVVTSPRRDVST